MKGLRRSAATQSDELRLGFPIEFTPVLSIRVFAIQCSFQPVLDADAPHPLHGGDARLSCSRDLRIAPAAFGAIDVGQQQDARVALALRTGFAFAQDRLELLALLRTESDVMLFLRHQIHLYTDKNSTSVFFCFLPSSHE